MSEAVPTNWKINPLGDIANVLDSRRIPLNSQERATRKGPYPYYGANGVQGHIDDFLFEGEYLLIAEDGGYFDEWQSRPISYLVDGKFWVNNHAHILQGKENFTTKFLHYSIVHKNILRYINGGTRAKLNQADMKEIALLTPPLPEQKKIATILTSVDTVIEKTQAQIDKLNDLKTGMMQELLTKGIGPDGKPHTEFKDSPVGRIPVGWEVESLKNILSGIHSGWSPVCEQRNRVGHEFGILKTTAVTWAGYTDSENKALPKEYESVESAIVQKHDILVTRKGPRERVGVCAYVNDTQENLMIPDTVFRMTVKNKAETNPAFITLSLSSDLIQRNWDKKKVGLAEAQVNINHSILNQTKIALPDPSEQSLIVERLSSIDSYLKRAKEKHASQKLVKKALMQDLLTGKVRVTPGSE